MIGKNGHSELVSWVWEDKEKPRLLTCRALVTTMMIKQEGCSGAVFGESVESDDGSRKEDRRAQHATRGRVVYTC